MSLFSQIFQMSPKGPLQFFSILQTNACSKTPKGPLLHFRHYATYRRPEEIRKKNRKKSKTIRIFFQFFPHAGTVEENT